MPQPDTVFTHARVSEWATLLGFSEEDAAIDLGLALDEVVNSVPTQYTVSVLSGSAESMRNRNRAMALLLLQEQIAAS